MLLWCLCCRSETWAWACCDGRAPQSIDHVARRVEALRSREPVSRSTAHDQRRLGQNPCAASEVSVAETDSPASTTDGASVNESASYSAARLSSAWAARAAGCGAGWVLRAGSIAWWPDCRLAGLRLKEIGARFGSAGCVLGVHLGVHEMISTRCSTPCPTRCSGTLAVGVVRCAGHHLGRRARQADVPRSKSKVQVQSKSTQVHQVQSTSTSKVGSAARQPWKCRACQCQALACPTLAEGAASTRTAQRPPTARSSSCAAGAPATCAKMVVCTPARGCFRLTRRATVSLLFHHASASARRTASSAQPRRCSPFPQITNGAVAFLLSALGSHAGPVVAACHHLYPIPTHRALNCLPTALYSYTPAAITAPSPASHSMSPSSVIEP